MGPARAARAGPSDRTVRRPAGIGHHRTVSDRITVALPGGPRPRRQRHRRTVPGGHGATVCRANFESGLCRRVIGLTRSQWHRRSDHRATGVPLAVCPGSGAGAAPAGRLSSDSGPARPGPDWQRARGAVTVPSVARTHGQGRHWHRTRPRQQS
eukprot:89248-Hanusia_phi.AAC.1